MAGAATFCGQLPVGEGCEVIRWSFGLVRAEALRPDHRALTSQNGPKFSDLHGDIIN